MDVGTITTALLALGAFALSMVLARGIRNAEDDVAAVVEGIVGTRVEINRPPAAIEEPVRWRLELLRPRGANGHIQSELTKPITAATRIYR